MPGYVFLYDLGSPYAWLAAQRVDALVEPAPEWVPVLLGAIFQATGRSSWALSDQRERGIAEVERRARERGLPAPRWPEPWPNDGLLAMRAATYAHECGRGRAFALAAFAVQFVEGRPISEAVNVMRAAERAGMHGGEILERAARTEVKRRLRAHTERALACGVFGVPTVLAGERVLWGDDALDLR